MKVWASKKSIRAEIADVPEGWLDRFAVEQPGDIRKFGDSRNATLDYRVSAVLGRLSSGNISASDEMGVTDEISI